ncbi:MAG: carboxypeptidase-like regulatory domain-containing protein, partial [Candidatus Solibacter sp.]
MPGAKITVTNIATNVGMGSVTNDTGSFVLPNLLPGDYSVRVEKAGFRASVLNPITVNAASSVRADFTMEVGSAQQTVEITADAVRLQTDNAKSATTITQKLVDDLPTVVGGALRSPFDLAILAPESKNFGDNNFQMGGGQAAGFGVSLDGVSATTTRALSNSWVAVNTPSLEAITEFTVETNGYKAEFGHAGGGQMTFSSRGGTNQLHGTAYEFLRNEKFDANQWFSNANKQPRQIYKQHDFGAAVGGPVWIPKIYNGKDKTFFYFSWESFRNRVGASTSFATVPTPEMYDGDFHNWVDKDLSAGGKMIQIYNPFSLTTDATGAQVRTPFAGNIIPKTLFDALGQKALAAFQGSGVLKPNVPASPGQLAYVRNNYIISNGTEVSPQNKYSVKLDHNLGTKDRFSGYIGWNRTYAAPGPSGPRTLPGNYSDYNDLQRTSDVYRFSWDHTFSPTILNRFYAGGNNWQENHDPIQATIKSGTHWKDKVCLPNAPDCDQNLVNLRFSEYSNWGGPANNGSENDIMSFNDDLTVVKGRHTLKFGGMFQHAWYNGFGRQDVAGRANFSFIGTGRPGDTNFTTAGGNSFASFLLGWATDGGIDTVRYIAQEWPYFAGYVQDDWRVNSKLTFNLGLRWEATLPPFEANDRWSDFDPARPNPGAGNIPGALIYAGSGKGREGTRTLADSWFKGFGPRVGMAYSISG